MSLHARSPSGPHSFQQTDSRLPPTPFPRLVAGEQESPFVFEPQDIFGSIYYRTSITLIQSSLNGHNTFVLELHRILFTKGISFPLKSLSVQELKHLEVKVAARQKIKPVRGSCSSWQW